MKKTALLLSLLLHTLLLFSQQKIFSYSHPGLSEKRFDATSIVDEEKDILLLSLFNNKSVRRILINKQGQSINLLQQFSIVKDPASDFRHNALLSPKAGVVYQKSSFIGGCYTDGKIIEIFRHRFSFEFFIVETNVNTGEMLSIDTVKSSISEKIISCINRNNKLFLMCYVKNTNNLIIYKKESQKPFSRTDLNIDISGFGKILDKSYSGKTAEFSDLFNRNGFAIYENNLRYPVLFTTIRNKAYIHKNHVIFLVTNSTLDTYLINVDLDNSTYTIQSFSNETGETTKSNKATASSLLIDSLLITSYAGDNYLHLNIFNTQSEQLIKSFKINSENISSVSADPIIKAGSFFSKADITHEDFGKFYKTAVANELSLSGYCDQGKLYLSFAAPYKQFITATTVLSVATSIAGTYFINSSPDTYGFLLTAFQSVKAPTFVGFNATLDMKDYNPTSQNPNFTVWEKITSFMSTHKLNLENCLFFTLNNYHYIGYLYSLTDKYIVHRFSEKGLEE